MFLEKCSSMMCIHEYQVRAWGSFIKGQPGMLSLVTHQRYEDKDNTVIHHGLSSGQCEGPHCPCFNSKWLKEKFCVSSVRT